MLIGAADPGRGPWQRGPWSAPQELRRPNTHQVCRRMIEGSCGCLRARYPVPRSPAQTQHEDNGARGRCRPAVLAKRDIPPGITPGPRPRKGLPVARRLWRHMALNRRRAGFHCVDLKRPRIHSSRGVLTSRTPIVPLRTSRPGGSAGAGEERRRAACDATALSAAPGLRTNPTWCRWHRECAVHFLRVASDAPRGGNLVLPHQLGMGLPGKGAGKGCSLLLGRSSSPSGWPIGAARTGPPEGAHRIRLIDAAVCVSREVAAGAAALAPRARP